MSSVVFCIHHKLGCIWSGELRKLKVRCALTNIFVPNKCGSLLTDIFSSLHLHQAHLNACKHDATACPNRCGAQIPRVMMTDHIQFTCTQRRTRCEFCRADFSGQALEEHAGTCAQEPIYCEAKCGQRVRRGRLASHMAADCAKRLRRCGHCTREFSADTLATHETQCPAAVPMVHGCTFKEAGCRFKGTRQLLDAHLEQNTATHLSLMVALSSRQGAQIAQLKGAVAKLSTNYTGTLLWKIADWSAKLSEARSKEGLELVSPPFYTSQYGYKLQASLFLNGNGPGEGTHMSVYIKVLPGEYDALLKWPFQHSVTFTLFEQGTESGSQGGVAESFVPDPSWANFQRPSSQPDSLGFGFPRFVSHELMGRRAFVRDDTCFLRVKVDPSKIVAV